MRYNTQTNNLEVYDGVTWQVFQTTYATVGLSYEAESLLNWARDKRNEELEFKALIEKHPGVKDLKEKLDIMVTLVTEQAKQGEENGHSKNSKIIWRQVDQDQRVIYHQSL